MDEGLLGLVRGADVLDLWAGSVHLRACCEGDWGIVVREDWWLMVWRLPELYHNHLVVINELGIQSPIARGGQPGQIQVPQPHHLQSVLLETRTFVFFCAF